MIAYIEAMLFSSAHNGRVDNELARLVVSSALVEHIVMAGNNGEF